MTYKPRKKIVGGTSKVTLIPVDKEASSQHFESSLKGLSNLTIPEDLLNHGFDNPEALKLNSPTRGDTSVQAQDQGEKTPISKETGPSGGNTRTHTNTCTSPCT